METDTGALPQLTTPTFNLVKKNQFRRFEKGAYREQFIQQVEENIKALSVGKLADCSMVRRHRRSGELRLGIGLGAKNEWFENDYVPRGHFASFRSFDDAAKALKSILESAYAGKFDQGLELLRLKRQEHADKMVRGRKTPKGTFATIAEATGEMDDGQFELPFAA